MMNKEIVTDPLGADDLWSDLRIAIDWLKHFGVTEVQVLFGFSWGSRIYEKEWKELPVALEELEQRVRQAETKNFGRLGNDNLYITIPPFEARLHYSYESDIHLSYAEENPWVTWVRERWLANQWMLESQRSKNYNR